MIAAGKLDRRIRLEKAISVRNAGGEKTRTWIPIAIDLPAGRELPSTRSMMNGQNVVAEVDTVFQIRYRADITPHEDVRVTSEGRTYRIKGVRELGRRVGLLLDCTTRAE